MHIRGYDDDDITPKRIQLTHKTNPLNDTIIISDM